MLRLCKHNYVYLYKYIEYEPNDGTMWIHNNENIELTTNINLSLFTD